MFGSVNDTENLPIDISYEYNQEEGKSYLQTCQTKGLQEIYQT